MIAYQSCPRQSANTIQSQHAPLGQRSQSWPHVSTRLLRFRIELASAQGRAPQPLRGRAREPSLSTQAGVFAGAREREKHPPAEPRLRRHDKMCHCTTHCISTRPQWAKICRCKSAPARAPQGVKRTRSTHRLEERTLQIRIDSRHVASYPAGTYRRERYVRYYSIRSGQRACSLQVRVN